MMGRSRDSASDAPQWEKAISAGGYAGKILRRRDELFKRIFSESPIGIVLYDPEGWMIAANKACRDMVGFPESFDSRLWANLFRDPTIPDDVKKRIAKPETVRYQTKVDYDELKRRGMYKGTRSGIRHVEVVTNPLGLRKGGVLLGYMSQVEDITGLKQAEEKLVVYQSQLRSLASQLSLAEEQERRRLAVGLHDQVGQNLGLIKFKLSGLRSALRLKASRSHVDEIRILVDEAIQQTRALTFELSPPILYELGLEPALEWLAEQYQAQYGISCMLKNDGHPKLVSDEIRGILFSSVRELLMNTVKHAKARTAEISIRRRGGNIVVMVRDDGVGFDTSVMRSNSTGFGLFNIRERLVAAGGRIELDSQPGSGTTVSLVVPSRASGGTFGREQH